ncbi:hypothetical protein Tco_0624206 [Tanacetum coccineum]|uniref:Reverse transcriptase domain-containing protein n=1 Tax=Tanacetum coccineum TaxID=301880 RepID=A0ABQ4WD96_9ASTR
MITPVEKRNASKFCEFHREVGHTTDECMHLKRQIEEMLKAGKLSHLIKEWKQNNGKDQTKTRIARQRITQTFSPESVISFPPLGEEDEMEGPMIIEAKWEDIACTAYMWTEAPPQKFCMNIALIDFVRKTLNFRLDELHGGKITLSLQRDYRKTRGKEDQGYPIHGTRNAKIPSGWRNSHIAEQQDHPARMLDGFRTRGAAACH